MISLEALNHPEIAAEKKGTKETEESDDATVALCDAVAAEIKKMELNPEEIKVCDMGCKFGLVGQELNRLGFANITGIDKEHDMLTISAKKQAYDGLMRMMVGSPSNTPESLAKHFEVVTISQLLYGPQSTAVFDEALNCLKKNGLAAFTTRESCLKDCSFQMVIDELSSKYVWKKVLQKRVPVPRNPTSPHETGHKDIIMFIFKKV